jgi:hypothetical protein
VFLDFDPEDGIPVRNTDNSLRGYTASRASSASTVARR